MSQTAAGHLVEDFARRLAGHLGVPDFVYQPVLVARGRSTREVSDGLLVAGARGLILQVKSREPEAGRADDATRIRTWSEKNAAAAVRQAAGTRRTLSMSPVRMRSLRGFDRELPVSAAAWPAVVILDHPADPALSLPAESNTVYISLGDWLELHRYVRSTHGVIDYVYRVLASGESTELGNEQARYTRFAAADLNACHTPTQVPTLLSSPLSGGQTADCAWFDNLIEAVADPTGATGWDATQYLHVVEALDRVPPLVRVGIGRKMRDTLADLRRTGSRRSFIVPRACGPGSLICFLYDVDTLQPGQSAAQTTEYGTLRRQHAIEAGADPATRVLAVGVHHHPQLGHRYTFFHSADDGLSLPADLRSDLEQRYGIFDGKTTTFPS